MSNRSLSYLCVFLGLFLLASSALALPENHHAMLRFWFATDADQAFMDQNHLRFQIDNGRRGEYVDIIVDEAQMAELLGAGSRVELLHEDIESFWASRLNDPMDWGDYHTFAEITAKMDLLHEQYPQVVSERWSLGQGHDGNDLWCFRISDNPGTDEQGEAELLFDGLTHANEIMGSEVCIRFAEYLAQNYAAGDQEIIALLDTREVYIVPVVNPDGMLYNEAVYPNGGATWRKNRRDNGSSYGVDLNRNYSYEWGCDYGSSGIPSSNTYRGPYAASEPEVQAMMALINAHDFVIRQSYHSSGDMTLYPWGYTTSDTPDEATFREMAAAMTQYNGYTPGQPGDILYDVCGDSFDWDYGAQTEHTKIFGFSNEIGASQWPSESLIVPLFEENIWPAIYMIQFADVLRGVSWQHEPLPFTADASATHTVVGTPAGYDGAEIIDAELFYRVDGGAFTMLGMTDIGGGDYAATIPAQADGAVVEYYLSASDDAGNSGSAPPLAPASLYYFELGDAFTHGMEAERGWSTGAVGDDANTGIWVRVDPVGTDAQPEDDHSGDGTMCWVTGQGTVGGSVGENDVDGGKTSLFSPVYDMTGANELVFDYFFWFSNDQGSSPNTDYWDVYLSNDGGESWVQLEHDLTSHNAWVGRSYDFFEHFAEAGQVQLKFVASDEGDGSIVEAALDDFHIAGIFDLTGAEDGPSAFRASLSRNFPNPFNPTTRLRFTLSEAEFVNLDIYDARGRLVKVLLAQEMAAGAHGVSWNGLDVMGRPVVSGVYFAKFRAGGSELSQRLVLLK